MAARAAGGEARGDRLRGGDRVLGAFQNFGRSLMLPIAVLPAAALLLRLGQPDLLDLAWMAAAGDAIFTNLPMIFAVGIAFGLAGGDGAAALAGLVGFLVFDGVFKTLIPQVDGGPDPDITMGVLSGIIVGLVAAGLYRRFSDIRLPDYLGFFGGRRFVPIVTALAALVLGAVFGLVWPTVQLGVNAVGEGIVGLGALGTGIYGFLNRMLIPVGLHHVLNTYVWFQLGTYNGPDGPVTGDLNRYFAGDPSAGYFMSGFFLVMMFGLPGACLAMIRHAHFPKVASGILLSAAFASFLTGITEPIEFAFMFVAPLLYLVHAVLTGTALAIATLLNIKIGFGFSAGLIDYVLNFGKQNTTHPLLILVLGVVYFAIYYFVFGFVIKRFDLATPGRGEASTGLAADWILPESQRGPRPGEEREAAREAEREAEHEAERSPAGAATATAAERDRDDVLAEDVLGALGGRENVESVEGCITRLRLFVEDPDRIDDARLKQLGAAGVVKRGKVAQVVMGTQSDRIAERINRLLKDGG
ncbi:MAG TPA: PTS transporter subunit EIIC [Rubrobacter sp.]|nr:PTS transporter subunit EIIC [Rubrobacter sp.]